MLASPEAEKFPPRLRAGKGRGHASFVRCAPSPGRPRTRERERTGIDYALAQRAEVIVTFDADGQHRVSDISRLTEALMQERADFALGSRFLGQAPNLPPLRRLLLRAATAFTRLTTGLEVSDTHNGLRAMTRRGAAAIRLRQNRMAHASEWLSQIAASGLRYVERPVTIDYTVYSLAKGQNIADAVLILLDLFARRLYR